MRYRNADKLLGSELSGLVLSLKNDGMVTKSKKKKKKNKVI